jgi:sugar/nucleoside kinase (ribokinase family)
LDVIGLGDADVDIYLRVSHLPGRDEKIKAEESTLYPGGMVANFLVGLRRLGTPCGFHGLLGADEFGRIALNNLIANDIDTRGAIIRPQGKTYFCVILLDSSGEKSLVTAPTDCYYPQPEDLSSQLISEAQHLHTTADNLATLERAIDIARKHKLTISLDIEPNADGCRPELRPLLSNIDIVFIKKQALSLLTGEEDLTLALPRLLDLGVKIICVTMGGKGVTVAFDTITRTIDAFPVPVIDSTGAGDAFSAAFVHAFLEKWSVVDAAQFASAAGAMSVSSYGGHAMAPTRAEVLAFLGQRNIKLSWQESDA